MFATLVARFVFYSPCVLDRDTWSSPPIEG